MWSDPRVWIPMLGVVVTISVTIIVHYLGNSEFRGKVRKAYVWCRVILFRRYIFASVIIPLLILCLAGLYSLHLLTINAVLVVYSVFLTVWSIHLKKQKKDLSIVASCRLGDDQSERGENGLIYVRHEDGDSVKEILEGELVRRSDVAKFQYYMYFTFRDDIVATFRKCKNIVVLVEFFDVGVDNYREYSFSVQYDSTDESHANPRFKTSSVVRMSGSKSWQFGVFPIRDGRFRKGQQDKADFRIKCRSKSVATSEDLPNLYVRRVVVTSLNE